MIPIILLDSLKVRFDNELKNILLNDPSNPDQLTNLNIYTQNLPIKSPKNSKSPFPFVCIRLSDGDMNDYDEYKCKILFVIGINDTSENNQGFRDAVMVTNRIWQSLTENPLVNSRFECDLKKKWSNYEDESQPFFYTGLETEWRIPVILRTDVEDMI